MQVRLIFKRIPHHAGNSGYDQLANYVDGIQYRKGLLYRLARKLPERRIQKISAFNSEWYQRESLWMELEMLGRLSLPGKRLYHYLYGEDSLRLTTRWRPRWNNKIVASFHQPPEIIAQKWGDKPFLKHLDGVVALCKEQAQYFYNFLPPERVFVVPHGVKTTYWQPAASSEKPDDPVFVNVGWWLRDIDMLKATIRRVHELDPRVRFRIVTFKHLFDKYDGLPATELVAGIPDDDLREEYRRARAILIPLEHVTANNAVLEAMACGTAVISTDHGGLPEYVDDASGIKVKRGDVDACVRAVLELAQDKQKSEAMGRAARTQALRFDWAVVGEQMSYVYGRILGADCAKYFHPDRTGPRNVCLLTEEYPKETGWGGIATYNYNLAHGLAAAGHNVYVIAGCVERPSVSNEGPGGRVEVHRVKFHPRKPRSQRIWWHWIQPFLRKRYLEFLRRLEFGLAAKKKFRDLQNRIPLHVVESPEYYGSAWFIQGKFGHYPVVVKLHTPTQVNCYINSVPVTTDVRLSNIFEKGSTKAADLVCAPCRKIMDLVRTRWIRSLRDIELLEYPIDPAKYEPSSDTWHGGTQRFLFTGRLEQRKGVHILVQAFDRVARALPHVELDMVGHDTPTFKKDGAMVHFKDYITSLDLAPDTLRRIHFHGRKTLEELIPMYRRAYACVIPSVSFENFPNSCLEALACGKAVIVTDAGGMVEMAPDRVAGLHAKAGDVDTLAAAIRHLAQHPEDTARFGEGARRTVMERYATDKMVRKITAAYERLIQSARYR
jgi:glycosyltransferase involved in cell wall biosynthesis